jgi:hypothetical protein
MPLRMQREKSSITRGTFERSRNVREYSAKLEDGMAAGSEEDSWECGYFFCLKMSILRENPEALLGSRMFFCWLFLGDDLLVCTLFSFKAIGDKSKRFEVILSLWFREWERIGELGILVQCLVQVNSRGQLDVKSGEGGALTMRRSLADLQ